MRILFLTLAMFFCTFSLFGQQSNDIKQSIISQAIFDQDGTLTMSWIPKVSTTSYRIQYRTELEGNWITEASGVVDSFYVFSGNFTAPVEVSITTENGDNGNSYMLVGNEYFNGDTEERMLLLVEESIYSEIEELISTYQNVLENELIKMEISVFKEEDDVAQIKDYIMLSYTDEPLDYILILGNLAVPYSGNSAIDGHTPDHLGAWVADGYYGELDGNWTDISVDNVGASREANWNIPGDGKFDQTSFPSDVEIAVGRVDFSDLPKLEQSEVELTRRYLQRNIDYRTGISKVTRRAVIDNNFNLGEGFGQGAIKSFHGFLEPDSINFGDFSQCTSQDYLFTFGAGGGSYESASGIISTNSLVIDSIQSVFTTIFGSYFGDWDVSNNLLRASLARGSSLINAWSGRPIWYFHPMAMGETVGTVLLNTQNNNGNYTSQFGKRFCHTTLLGDPSLKMYYHEPVDNVVIGSEEVSWEYLSDDPEVVGYTVYYLESQKWKLLGDGPRTETSLLLSEVPVDGMTQLLIRPVGLIHSRSGSYYNEGNGVQVEALVINTEEYINTFHVYPNPASDYLTISGQDEIGQVMIYNVYGQLVESVVADYTVAITDLIPGVYFLQINETVVRFVKE